METVRFNNMDGLTHNCIINAMREMAHKEKFKHLYSFDNNKYHWEIGFEVLRRLKDTNPNLRDPSEIDEILGIKVGKILYHRDDPSIIRLIIDYRDYADYADDRRLKYLKWNSNSNYGLSSYKPSTEIKNVIFNNPATIVFWSDGTKTVVKAENEPFDPEKGLAMAIAKKALGNEGNYYNEFKKWIPEEEEVPEILNKKMNISEDKKTLTKKYYTVKELSEKELVTPDKIRRRIKNGLYPGAIKQSGAWLIPYTDLKGVSNE